MCGTTEDVREYQSWHLSVEQELAKLKEEKKRAKHDYKLAGNVLRENTYTALSVELENESVMDAEKVVMPEYVLMRDVETNLNNTIGEDVIFEDADSKEVQLDDVIYEDTMLVESDAGREMIDGKSHTDKKEYERGTEQRQDSMWSDEDIMPGEDSEVEMSDSLQEKVRAEVVEIALVDTSIQGVTKPDVDCDFPERYTEYLALELEHQVKLHGFLDEELDETVFEIVRKNFDKAGYGVGFDGIYDETTVIERYISEKRCINSAEMIVEKLKGYGAHEKIPSSVKAEVFGFEIDDSSGNLKLYMQVVKKLGVRMKQSEMFEDYQKVYEETIKRHDEFGMQKDRMRECGKVR